MEFCDYGHEAEEVRLLPTGGGGNMIVCREHYTREIMFRFTRNKEMGRKGFQLPRWDDLKIYEGGS